MSVVQNRVVNLGQFYAGLVGTVGVKIVDATGAIVTARTTAGITEIAPGCYQKVLTFADDFQGAVVWDDAVVPTISAVDEVNVELETSQALVKKFQRNRWKLDSIAKTLTYFDDDGITPLRVFDLKDSGGAPSVTAVFERIPV